MGRIMAIDYGAKTAGIALSDPDKLIATPLKTVFRSKEGALRATLREICFLARDNDAELIVIGLALNMDGSRSERAAKSEEFASVLRRRLDAAGLTDVAITLWDERLTTFSAEEIMQEAQIPPRSQKLYVDKIAAALILEDFIKNGLNQKSD